MSTDELPPRRSLLAVLVLLLLVPGVALAADDPAPLVPTSTTQQLDLEPIAQIPKKPASRHKPTAPQPRKQPPAPPPTVTATAPAVSPNQLAELYVRTGRALHAARQRDPDATIDLWPRYRWVNFFDAIRTPEKRAQAAALLEKLLAEATQLAP